MIAAQQSATRIRRQVRIKLTGTLIALSPLHIGGQVDGLLTDAPLFRDGHGRPAIPGTSLAGALRTQLVGGFVNIDEQEAHRLVGSVLWGASSDDGRASRVIVDDAVIQGEYSVEVRQGVSIERQHAVAAGGHLFSRELLSAGSRFSFGLEVEADESTVDACNDLVDMIIRVLTESELAIGAGTSAGLGRVSLVDYARDVVDLRNWTGIKAALSPRNPELIRPDADAKRGPRPGFLRTQAPWHPLGPVLSKVAVVGGAIDAFPLVTRAPGGIHLLLPGTSIKGVFRSHAERIVRTVSRIPLPAGGMLEQLKAEHLHPIGDLFGLAGDQDGSGKRGALVFHDVLSTHPLDESLWYAVRFAEGASGAKGELDKDLALATAATSVDALNDWGAREHADEALWFDLASRNGIDRWTGAAADGKLFSALEPTARGSRSWGDLVVDLDWALLERRHRGEASAIPGASLALLLLVLRDFSEGWIGFGSGTTRGLGAIHVPADQVTFSLGPTALEEGQPSSPANFSPMAIDGSTLEILIAEQGGAAVVALADRLDEEWKRVIAQNSASFTEPEERQ